MTEPMTPDLARKLRDDHAEHVPTLTGSPADESCDIPLRGYRHDEPRARCVTYRLADAYLTEHAARVEAERRRVTEQGD